ncbi:MAG: amidohydrolase family protein, partial [Gammaproteobacteria bacterium]|nr:amidohydrolase family protein [Gammaproteobacteria bacterium]
LEEMLTALQDCAAERAKDEWLVAGLFSYEQFPEGKPHRSYLDEVFPDTPVLLRERTFHHALANTRALEIAGIDENTKTPYGGSLPRDKTGRLTGELVETATELVEPYLPTTPADLNLAALRWAVEINNQYGITSVQEASAHLPTLQTLAALEAEGGLSLHVAAHLIWGSPQFGGMDNDGLEQLIEQREDYASGHVDVDFIKIWVDGAPTPPYFTQADVLPDGAIEFDRVLFPADVLNDAVIRFDRMGLKIKLHVAGDGSARAALDAVEAARNANPGSSTRHELGHTNLVTPDDMPRFAELGVIAEMSPSTWHIFGRLLGDPPRDAWEFGTLHKHGAMLTIGTDWVVTPTPNLFPALEGMLDRGDESIDLPAALRAMTFNGAYAVGRETVSGSLEQGKSADFIVLDRNLFDIPVPEISETRVLRTVFEGSTVYTAANSD